MGVHIFFFSLKKGTNSKLHIKRHVHICNSDKSVVEFQIYSGICFRLNTLPVAAKAPVVDLLRNNTLKDTKTAFLIAKRYDW